WRKNFPVIGVQAMHVSVSKIITQNEDNVRPMRISETGRGHQQAKKNPDQFSTARLLRHRLLPLHLMNMIET
ncbi:MAG: hypothetical protein AAF497_19295, partial [Planctomycetota bacterium]